MLKIRRRKFKRTFQGRRDRRHPSTLPHGRKRIFAERQALPLARHPGPFHGHGAGTGIYAIIEQGRIGQILSSKPTDRRAIIEEAAGITKFKTRKRLAEARLEDAKLNLSRINDIFDEVTRQMNSLKRQAAKATLCEVARRNAG